MASTRHPALDLRFAPGPGAGSLQDFLYAELDAYEPIAIQEHETGDGWRVFFRTSADRNAARAALQSEFRNALIDLSAVDVDDEDWARRSQAGLKAVQVGNIVVAPPGDVGERRGWGAGEPGSQGAGEPVTVVIEPSMGFGTGHHSTTRLCLELLQRIGVAGERVIDVGTGSGVLAIAAAKLGASHVLGIDNDADALVNARENVARNTVQDRVELGQADVAALHTEAAGVVLANLTGAVIQRLAANLIRLLTPTGLMIVSGFAPDEAEDVVTTLHLECVEQRRDGDWAALLLRFRDDARPASVG